MRHHDFSFNKNHQTSLRYLTLQQEGGTKIHHQLIEPRGCSPCLEEESAAPGSGMQPEGGHRCSGSTTPLQPGRNQKRDDDPVLLDSRRPVCTSRWSSSWIRVFIDIKALRCLESNGKIAERVLELQRHNLWKVFLDGD